MRKMVMVVVMVIDAIRNGGMMAPKMIFHF